ncbi:MAG: type II secretion system protein GspM [Hyphomicrobium sp.]
MTSTVRALAGKLSALVILFGAVYGVVRIAIEPLAVQHAGLEESIAVQRNLLGRLQSAAASEKEAAGSPDSKLALARSGPVFLAGESDAIRISGLQSKLSESAQSVGARLASTQAVAPREDGGVRLVGVQTQFAATLEQLQRFIYDLETSRPPLFVDTLNVSRGPSREGEELSDLDIRLIVLGATPGVRGQP